MQLVQTESSLSKRLSSYFNMLIACRHLHVISSGSATSIILTSDDNSQKPEELQTRSTNTDLHHSDGQQGQ